MSPALPARSTRSLALRSRLLPTPSHASSSRRRQETIISQARCYSRGLPPPLANFEAPTVTEIQAPKRKYRKSSEIWESMKNDRPTEWILPIPEPVPKVKRPILLPKPLPAAANNPLKIVRTTELGLRDPTGARARLFDKLNPECVNPGDVILVRQRSGEPFAGVIIRLIRKSTDTSVLLRNTLTGVGVEMEFKVFSPNITSIEVVKRREKVPMYSRLYYMRQPKHDPGSLEGVVRNYLRQRGAAVGRMAGMDLSRSKGKGKKK